MIELRSNTALEKAGKDIAKKAMDEIRVKRHGHSRKEIEQSVKETCSYFRKKAVGLDGSTQFFQGTCLKACLNDGKKCTDCRHFSFYQPAKRNSRQFQPRKSANKRSENHA